MSTYRHSGRFTASGLLAGLCAGATAGIVVAFAYSYATVYIPVVGVFTFVLAGGFGALVAFAAAKPMIQLKVRSQLVGGVVGFITTLVAFWASWVVWVYATLHRADVPIPFADLLSPATLWADILQINAVGAWTLKGHTPTGTELWVLWGGEAAIVLGIGTLVGFSSLSDPFCESCENWCRPYTGILFVAGTEPADMKKAVESRDLEWIESVGPVPEGAFDWYRFDTFECGCRKTCTLSVQHVMLDVEKGGKTKETTKAVVDKLVITADEADDIRSIASHLAEGLPSAA